MAKIVKRKRKLRIEAFATLFFVVSVFLYLGAVIGLKSYNVTLAAQSQELEVQRDVQKEKVASLENEVKKLADSERVLGMAKDAGISTNQKNIVTIPSEK